jgi:hypothetical protein
VTRRGGDAVQARVERDLRDLVAGGGIGERALVVVGAAGLGKSRLVAEVAAAVAVPGVGSGALRVARLAPGDASLTRWAAASPALANAQVIVVDDLGALPAATLVSLGEGPGLGRGPRLVGGLAPTASSSR